MKNFNRGDRFGGRSSDSYRGRGGRSGGGRMGGDGRTQMHEAICADCGRDCEVPFKPTGSRPVYCSDCFGGNDDSYSDRSEKRSYSRKSDSRDSYRDNDRRMFYAVCDECGDDCEVPFRPSKDKPIFCSKCFESVGGKNKKGGNNDGVSNEKFEELNSKVDKMMGILDSMNSMMSAYKKEVKKTEEKKIIKKAESTEKEEKKKPVKKAIAKKKATKEEKPKKAIKKTIKKVAAKKEKKK